MRGHYLCLVVHARAAHALRNYGDGSDNSLATPQQICLARRWIEDRREMVQDAAQSKGKGEGKVALPTVSSVR